MKGATDSPDSPELAEQSGDKPAVLELSSSGDEQRGFPAIPAGFQGVGWERRLAAWLVGLAVLAVLLFSFVGEAREVFAAAFISLIIASSIRTPALALARRTRISFSWSALLVYLLALALTIALLLFTLPGIISEAQQSVGDLERLRAQLNDLLAQFRRGSGDPFELPTIDNLSEQLTSSSAGFFSWQSVAASVGSGALWALGILALSFYWLLDRDRALSSLLRRVPEKHTLRTRQIYEEIEDGLGRFVLGQLTAGLIVGAIAALILMLLGVPYALSLGLILMVCELLPAVGGWIAGILMAVVAANQSLQLALVVILFYFALQQLDSYVISPIVQQRVVHLRPLVVLMAILLGGATLGVVGALLGVPAAIALTVFLRHLYPERDSLRSDAEKA